MKKILASLASLAMISSSVTSVVSCGPVTFNKLMIRQSSTEVYRGTYKAPISNWSSAVTMQLEDSIILTNAEDTLLATDQHNNFEGDLADSWETTPENTTWFFHVRDNAYAGHWTSIDTKNNQIDQGQIKPTDFYNAFRYIFNPNNMSQVIGIWQTIIKSGDQLVQFINDIRNKDNHSLYDERFTITDYTKPETIVQSNYYLDRAIMAFNLTLDPDQARTKALDSSITTEALIADSFKDGQIINNSSSNSNYNLSFNLEKPAPYFESMAAFLSFAPLPDLALDYVSHPNLAGSNYGKATKDGKFGYQNIYYSGAYVVSDYNPTLRIKMKQNQFYFNQKNISIKELDYAYIGNVDASRQRFYFETGDISEVGIQPTDLAGWNRYVGDDINNLKFEGVNPVSRPQAGTYTMLYNYHSNLANGESANLALSQRSVRGMIRYVFDRSKIASYYSKAMDNGSSTSSMLRNLWTSKNLVVYKDGTDEKDYVDYMTSDYFNQDDTTGTTTSQWLNQELEKFGLTEDSYDKWSSSYGEIEENGQTKSALSDGYDGLMKNDLLGALIFVDDNHLSNSEITPRNPEFFNQYVQLIGKYDSDSENQKLDLIKKQVSADLNSYDVNNTTLTWLANGATSTTINNNIKDAVRTFNQKVGNDSPIKIEVVESSDASDYVTKMANGEFSIVQTGWVPDYSDPYTFIHTFVAGGDLEAYTGFGKIFDKSFDSEGNIKLNIKETINHPEAYQDLQSRLETFTNEVSKIDKTVPEENERYTEFAKIENYAFLESVIALPMLFQLADESPFISYVNPFTRSTFTSGQAIYRFIGVKMVTKLWTHQEFNDAKTVWENEKGSYTAVYPDKNGDFVLINEGKWPTN